MNISKVNSTSFKGYLTIQYKNEFYKFNTKNIKSVTNSHKDKGVIIEGRGVVCDGDFEPIPTNMKLLLNYSTFSPNTVIAAYKAAKQSDKAEIIIKS